MHSKNIMNYWTRVSPAVSLTLKLLPMLVMLLRNSPKNVRAK